MRFTPYLAAHGVPAWDALVQGGGFVTFFTDTNVGIFGDRDVHPTLLEAGLVPDICCREVALIRLETLSATTGSRFIAAMDV